MAVSVAYVLAAGLGTRLRPLTNVRCKPLVEVCGTPLIVFVLRLLEQAGVRRVGINSHWLHPQLQESLGDRFRSLDLTFVHEPEVLGTGGGLRGLSEAVPPPSGERVLVMNADALIDLDIKALVQAGAASPDALATLVLKATPDAARYGTIGTDEEERIVTFAGRVEPQGPVAQERMFCGVHLVDPRAFEVLPPVTVTDGVAQGVASGINDDGYPQWLTRGALLRGFDTTGTFCDVGTPERLLEANLKLLDGSWSSAHLKPFSGLEQRDNRVYVARDALVHSTARLVGPALIGPGAIVESGAVVEGAVVGRGAVVPRGVRVARSVLQSGARARENLEGVIAWPEGQLVVPLPGEGAA